MILEKSQSSIMHRHCEAYLNNIWLNDDYLDEPPFPPFNTIGEILNDGMTTDVEDPDVILDIYEKAFQNWNRTVRNHFCKALIFIFQELNLLDNECCEPIKHTQTGELMLMYMNICRSSQYFANITRKFLFPNFRTLLFSKREVIKQKKDDILHLDKSIADLGYKLNLWQFGAFSFNESHFGQSSINNYRQNGSIMHIHAGSLVMQDLLAAYNLSELDTFIPGRIVSVKLPYLASTPDFCVSVNEDKFQQFYKMVMNRSPISHEMKIFAPYFWVEIKTLQKLTVDYRQLENLYLLIDKTNAISCDNNMNESLLTKCKFESVDILTHIFMEAEWMFDENNIKKTPVDILMQRKTLLVSQHFAEKCKLEKINKNKLKHLFNSETSSVKKVPILPMIQSGRGWIFVYQKKGSADKCIFSLMFNTAPFILGPTSPFYVQILEQMCCVQYLNSNATFLFIAIMKHTPTKDDADVNRPCLAYAYEVLIPDCVRLQYEKRCFHVAHRYLGYETPIANSGENVLNKLMWNDDDYNYALCTVPKAKRFISS